MSKASEWMKAQGRPCWRAAKPDEHGRLVGSTFQAAVYIGGAPTPNLGIWCTDDLKRGASGFENPHGVLLCDEAIALARWILDTFGEDAPR